MLSKKQPWIHNNENSQFSQTAVISKIIQSCPTHCDLIDYTVQLSHPYMTTGKTIALTRRIFVGKVMSLLLNMLSRLVITFLPRSKHLLISDYTPSVSLVQSLSHVRLFATPWIAVRQASLSIINSRSSLRLTSIESVMPSSHLILCRPLLLLPPIPPSIRIFSNESTLRMTFLTQLHNSV